MRSLAIMLIVLTMTAGGCSKQSEPVYEGKALTEWVKMLEDRSMDTKRAAGRAIVAIGPDAIPAVVKVAESQTDESVWVAVEVLSAIAKNSGSAAKDAVPALVGFLEKSLEYKTSPDSPDRMLSNLDRSAIDALKSIGPDAREAIPVLREMARTVPGSAPIVIEALRGISAEAAESVSAEVQAR